MSEKKRVFTPVDPSDDATIKVQERAYASPIVPMLVICVPILLLMIYAFAFE